MRRLKVALVALFAVVLSLALFACGKKASDWIDTIDVSGGTGITIDDAAKEDTARAELEKLTFTAIYFNGTEDRKIESKDLTVDWSGVTFGKTGSYTVHVSTNKDNKDKVAADVPVTITHHFVAGDKEGTQVCSVCSAVSITETINDSFEIGPWHDGVTVGTENKYVKLDTRLGNATSVVGRLDKGMKITLSGKGKALSKGNDYNYPILGVANIEDNGSVILRNDNYTIYDAMAGVLNGWFKNADATGGVSLANTDAIAGWVGADAATLYQTYTEGTISHSVDYYVDDAESDGIDISLSWEYGEDNVVIWTWYWNNGTTSRTRTAYVKLPDRQFYNAILHGEQFKAKFTKVEVVQTLKLKEVGEPKVTDAKKVLENKYFDKNCFDIDVTYEGGKTGKADAGMITVYGNPDEVAADKLDPAGRENQEGGQPWEDLAYNPVSSKYKTYKVRVELGNDAFEKVLSATENAKLVGAVVKNAVEHGNTNDVTVDSVLFPATALNPIEFVQTSDNKAGVSVSGTAATLSTAQAAKLTLGTGTAKHYVAFSLYTDPEGGATKFAGTPTVTGTKGAVAVAADGARLDVVLAVSADVKSATISGVNGGTDIVVSFGKIGGYAVTSTLSANTLKINETKQITIEYDISGVTAVKDAATAASQLKLSINGVNKTLKANGNTLTPATQTVMGFAGLTVDEVTYATGKLTVKYTLPKMNPAKPVGYTFTLFSGSETLATDRVFYTLGFAENDNAVVDGYYAVADGNYLYLLKPYTGSDIKTADLNGVVTIALNAGAKTGVDFTKEDDPDFKSYTYLKTHNISYVTGEDGTVSMTDSKLLAELATGNLTVFGGTANNSEDTDYGAVVVLRIDTRKVGVREQSFAFELNGSGNSGSYVPVTYDTTKETYTMGQAKSYTLTGEATQVNDVDPEDCTAEVTHGYELGGTGDNAEFYANVSFTKNEHNWLNSQNQAAAYGEDATCSRCGAERFKVTVSNTTYEWVELEGPVDVPNTSYEWWAGATGVVPGMSGDFAVKYTYTHADGTGNYTNARLMLVDSTKGAAYAVADADVLIDLANPDDANATVTSDGKAANVTKELKIDGKVSTEYLTHGNGNGEFNGNVTALIKRVGNVLTVTSSWTSKTEKKYECKVVISNVKSNDVTVQIGGWGAAVTNLKVQTGTVTTYGPKTYAQSEFQKWGDPVPRYYTVKDNEKVTLEVEWNNGLEPSNFSGAVVNLIGVEGKNYFLRPDAEGADSTGDFQWRPAGVTFPEGKNWGLTEGKWVNDDAAVAALNATKKDGKQVIEVSLQGGKLTITFSFYAKGQTNALASWTCYIADAPAASYNMELAIDHAGPATETETIMTAKSITVTNSML